MQVLRVFRPDPETGKHRYLVTTLRQHNPYVMAFGEDELDGEVELGVVAQ
jgi:hypothetical protein